MVRELEFWISVDIRPIFKYLSASGRDFHPKTSNSNLNLTSFKVFNKYLQDFDFAEIICIPPLESQQQSIQNPAKHFIFKTSINRSRALIKQHTSIYLRQLLESLIINEPPRLQLQNRLDAILDKRMSIALFTTSRSQYQHHLPNNIFDVT